MRNLEKYGDTTYIEYSKAMPNSLSRGIEVEMRWSFIEIRERRDFFRTTYDRIAHVLKAALIGSEDKEYNWNFRWTSGTK